MGALGPRSQWGGIRAGARLRGDAVERFALPTWARGNDGRQRRIRRQSGRPSTFRNARRALGVLGCGRERRETGCGDEEQERAGKKRMGGVSVAMVAMPPVGQFVEPVVFNVPTSVAGAYDRLGGGEPRRKAGHPEPLGLQVVFFAVVLTAHGALFERAHDTDPLAAWGPGSKSGSSGFAVLFESSKMSVLTL